MKKYITGYKRNSKDRNEPILEIPSNSITMENVPHSVIGVDDNGRIQVMKPNKNYYYPNTQSVVEIPVKQKGGNIMKKTRGQNFLGQFEQYLGSLTDTSQNEIMDYVDSLTEQERFQFLHGGVAKWREFQRGGMVPVEVEGEETVQKPNGNLYEFKGKKHSQGGIDVSLEEGSRIFSEHLKIKPEEASAILGKKVNKKLSYADLSKRFDTTKYSKILNNPNADKYEIETAKMKLAHNNSMLDLIFNAQEANKAKTSKDKFQGGGIVPTETPLGRIKRMYTPEQNVVLPEVTIVGNKIVRTPTVTPPIDISYEPDYTQFPIIHQEPSPTVTTGVVLNDQRGYRENLTPKATTVLDIVDPNRKSRVPLPVTTVPKKTGTGKSKTNTSTPVVTTEVPTPYTFDKIEPFAPLPGREIKSLERGVPDISDSKVTPVAPTKEEKSKWDFGIGSKLANTILDIGLAASDKLRIVNPQYRDLRKYPLFSRFVDFDDKEAGRNMALNIQQIQNSNMPEEVKQARIADINAQYRDYTAKIDFANAQRYEQKISQDTEKLQNYINANIDQHYQDIERYNEQKARVDYLKDQFKAQKKARIVNSIKAYTNYVDELAYKSAIIGDNYKVNPITGKVVFTEGKKDPLKKQEDLLAQYSQNSKNQVSLPNGASLMMLNETTGIVTDANGKTEIVKLK